MNTPISLTCPEHGNEVYPFWSKKNKEWFCVCNYEFPKPHFVRICDDMEYDRGFQGNIDMDYQVNNHHE